MERMRQRMRGAWVIVTIVLSLSVLGAIDISPVAAQTGAGALCVVQITADGQVLGILVDQPTNFNIALLVPETPDKKVNVPVTCASLETIGLAVTNQKTTNINVSVQVFTNRGELICAKGPFLVEVNGGRGVTFSDCL
jgi:hypothetical protein